MLLLGTTFFHIFGRSSFCIHHLLSREGSERKVGEEFRVGEKEIVSGRTPIFFTPTPHIVSVVVVVVRLNRRAKELTRATLEFFF